MKTFSYSHDRLVFYVNKERQSPLGDMKSFETMAKELNRDNIKLIGKKSPEWTASQVKALITLYYYPPPP
jgi:hypothetical protein